MFVFYLFWISKHISCLRLLILYCIILDVNKSYVASTKVVSPYVKKKKLLCFMLSQSWCKTTCIARTYDKNILCYVVFNWMSEQLYDIYFVGFKDSNCNTYMNLETTLCINYYSIVGLMPSNHYLNDITTQHKTTITLTQSTISPNFLPLNLRIIFFLLKRP